VSLSQIVVDNVTSIPYEIFFTPVVRLIRGLLIETKCSAAWCSHALVSTRSGLHGHVSVVCM